MGFQPFRIGVALFRPTRAQKRATLEDLARSRDERSEKAELGRVRSSASPSTLATWSSDRRATADGCRGLPAAAGAARRSTHARESEAPSS